MYEFGVSCTSNLGLNFNELQLMLKNLVQINQCLLTLQFASEHLSVFAPLLVVSVLPLHVFVSLVPLAVTISKLLYYQSTCCLFASSSNCCFFFSSSS